MRIIVVGGGRIGSSLLELALADGHDLTLIEPDEERPREAAERFDVRVLNANIADGGILEEADARRAEVLAATTGDDSANLMAMVLGLEHAIPTLVSVVNEKSHRALFQRLGVHVLVDPEIIVAQHLYGLVRTPELVDAVSLPGGGQTFQVVVRHAAPLAGRTLAEAREEGLLAEELVVVWLRRGGQTRVPGDESRIAPGDELTVFSPGVLGQEQLKAFTG